MKIRFVYLSATLLASLLAGGASAQSTTKTLVAQACTPASKSAAKVHHEAMPVTGSAAQKTAAREKKDAQARLDTRDPAAPARHDGDSDTRGA